MTVLHRMLLRTDMSHQLKIDGKSILCPKLPPFYLFFYSCFNSGIYSNGKPNTREELMAKIVDAIDSWLKDP